VTQLREEDRSEAEAKAIEKNGEAATIGLKDRAGAEIIKVKEEAEAVAV
jgi:hypothetical protein